MAELIIALTLLRIVQNIIGLGRLLEFLLGRLVPRIAIRVILHRQLAIGGLNLVRRRRLADTKHLVVISLLCHFVSLSRRGRRGYWGLPAETTTWATRRTLPFSIHPFLDSMETLPSSTSGDGRWAMASIFTISNSLPTESNGSAS